MGQVHGRDGIKSNMCLRIRVKFDESKSRVPLSCLLSERHLNLKMPRLSFVLYKTECLRTLQTLLGNFGSLYVVTAKRSRNRFLPSIKRNPLPVTLKIVLRGSFLNLLVSSTVFQRYLRVESLWSFWINIQRNPIAFSLLYRLSRPKNLLCITFEALESAGWSENVRRIGRKSSWIYVYIHTWFKRKKFFFLFPYFPETKDPSWNFSLSLSNSSSRSARYLWTLNLDSGQRSGSVTNTCQTASN